MFILLLCYGGSLATKSMSLNNEPSYTFPYWIKSCRTFMVSLDECSGSFLNESTKISVPSKTKVFNMIRNKSDAKTFIKHISFDCKWRLNSTTYNSEIEQCQCECESYQTCKKYYSWNPRTCVCENSIYKV